MTFRTQIRKAKSVLRISDVINGGGNTVELLRGSEYGFHVCNWEVGIAGLKEGGIYRDNALMDGSTLRLGTYSNVIETFTIYINDAENANVIKYLNLLLTLLQKARSHWLANWQYTSVYLESSVVGEDAARYASIVNYSLPGIPNPYAQPYATASDLKALGEFDLVIERKHWADLPPGLGVPIPISANVDFPPDINAWLLSSAIASTPVDTTEDPVHDRRWLFSRFGEFRKATMAQWAAGHWELVHDQDGPIAADAEIIGGYFNPGTAITYAYGPIRSGINLYQTTDGDTWTAVTHDGTLDTIMELTSFPDRPDILLATGAGESNQQLMRSINGGTQWQTVVDHDYPGHFTAVVALEGGVAVTVGTSGFFYRSDDYGVTWESLGRVFDIELNNIKILKWDPDLKAILGWGKTGTKVNSLTVDDLCVTIRGTADGLSWSVLGYNDDLWIQGVTKNPNHPGNYFCIACDLEPDIVSRGIALWESRDFGVTWSQTYGMVSGNVEGYFDERMLMYYTTLDRIFYGYGVSRFEKNDSSWAYHTGLFYTVNMGPRDHIERKGVNVINASLRTNITTFGYDRGTGSIDTFSIDNSKGLKLFEDGATSTHYLYFGSRYYNWYSGSFFNVTFNIEETMQGDTGITWQFLGGDGVWRTISDKLIDNTQGFTKRGYHTVLWQADANHGWNYVNGIYGYWVRCFPTDTVAHGPKQSEDDVIFAATVPYVEIDDKDSNCTYPPLITARISNLSDKNGYHLSDPVFYSTRLLVGLRSLSRGADFTPFVNIVNPRYDNNNPVGIRCEVDNINTILLINQFEIHTMGAARSWISDSVTNNEFMTTTEINFGPAISTQYHGEYRAFLRGWFESGTLSNVYIRLMIESGTGGIKGFTREVQFDKWYKNNFEYTVLDMGDISIPPSGVQAELGDTLKISVQMRSSSTGTDTVYMVDLVLIPVDEWAADAQDVTNTLLSEHGRHNNRPKMLEIDSIHDPEHEIRSIVRQADDAAYVTSVWKTITNGRAKIQASSKQRLYFFCMNRFDSPEDFEGGNTFVAWMSPPQITNGVQIEIRKRYLAWRDDPHTNIDNVIGQPGPVEEFLLSGSGVGSPYPETEGTVWDENMDTDADAPDTEMTGDALPPFPESTEPSVQEGGPIYLGDPPVQVDDGA